MSEPSQKRTDTERKRAIRALADELAPQRDEWIARNAYYYEEDIKYSQFLVRPGLRVLDLGCGTGDLLASLRPSRGVGVDFSAAMVAQAAAKYPQHEVVVGDIEDP